jgi:hypothetical protein
MPSALEPSAEEPEGHGLKAADELPVVCDEKSW